MKIHVTTTLGQPATSDEDGFFRLLDGGIACGLCGCMVAHDLKEQHRSRCKKVGK